MSRTPAGRGARVLPLVLASLAISSAATANAAAPLKSTPKPARAKCADQDVRPSAYNLRQIRSATLCLINGQRRRHGLRPVSQNRSLGAVASAYSRRLVTERFFAHVAPDGTTFNDRIERARYTRSAVTWSAGENLGWGTGYLATPRNIVKAWMRSPGHRRNLLRPIYRDIGIGVTPDCPTGSAKGNPAGTYTTVFGRRHTR